MDAFYMVLCKVVETYGYPSFIETRLVRDQFIVDLRDRALVDKLCQSSELMLEEARLQARIDEDSKSACGTLFAVGNPPVLADAVSHLPCWARVTPPLPPAPCKPGSACSRHGSSPRQHVRKARGTTATSCHYCGRAAHTHEKCPSCNTTCRNCCRKGCFSAVCEQPKCLGYFKLHAGTPRRPTAKYIHVLVNGRSVYFKVDTGPEVAVVPAHFLGLPSLLQPANGCCRARATSPWRFCARLTPH